MRNGVPSWPPGAVKGARFLRVHRSEAETLDGEDGRISYLSEGKGAGGVRRVSLLLGSQGQSPRLRECEAAGASVLNTDTAAMDLRRDVPELALRRVSGLAR